MTSGFKKLSAFLLLVILFYGCSTPFKARWANFNAYYNTFYNARQSFAAGVEKNHAQTREYNPLQPIRIHQTPVNAGAQEFDDAIEKAADVLRKFEETKWVDDALFLIGKSYFYLREYFSAEQKFQELYVTTENADLKQKAVFWRGRVLLEMNRHGEAIAYLNEQMDNFEGSWKKNNLAETKAVLAQHFVSLENWQQAAVELEPALRNLPLKEYRERGYFLLGQIFENLNQSEAAFEAFREVQNHFYEYRLQYLAKRKQAEVARNLGRHDVASALFNEMIRDDKNIEYKTELDFQLARTEQRRGNIQKAESIFKALLRNRFNPPTAEIAAQTYNSLAEIYRHHYNDFSMAAAYYDSAAQKNVPADRLPEDFNAAELAQSFGNYAHLKTEIALQDSLLWLSSLEPAAFDSVIAELRAKKIAEIRKQRAAQESLENTMITVNQNQEETDVASLRHGFLNSDNPVLQQNAKMQFYAVWGDRPLADHWRVRSLIRNTASSDENGDGNLASNAEENIYVTIDISRVPFTKNEQDSVRNQITSYQYQLGNLFFLSMNMPDSAVYYFEKAVENPSDENVTVVSLYSLSELYSMQGNIQLAREYAEILIQNFPDTEYADRLSEIYNIEIGELRTTKVDTLQVFQAIVDSDSISSETKAEKLKNFAQNFGGHELAARAQWESIQLYLNLAKSDPDYESDFNEWVSEHQDWETYKSEFEVLKDSAKIMLNDTTLTPQLQEYYQSLSDSTLKEPDFAHVFPYYGPYWDSTRSAINYYLEHFNGARGSKHVQILNNELALPKTETDAEEDVDLADSETGETENTDYLNCTELEQEPVIRGGMQRFLAELDLPQNPEIKEISYRFLINQRGIIDDFILLSQNAPENIAEIFEEAFQKISFEPVLVDGETVPVQCDLSFPLVD